MNGATSRVVQAQRTACGPPSEQASRPTCATSSSPLRVRRRSLGPGSPDTRPGQRAGPARRGASAALTELSGSEQALHQSLAALTNSRRASLLETHSRSATLDVFGEIVFKALRIYGLTKWRVPDLAPDLRRPQGGARPLSDRHAPPAAFPISRGLRPSGGWAHGQGCAATQED